MPSNNFTINNGNSLVTNGIQVNPIVPSAMSPNGTGIITSNRFLPDSEYEPLSSNQDFYAGCQRDIPISVNEDNTLEQITNSTQNQPEILFTMDFNPLFAGDVDGNVLTRHGDFFQTQLAFKNLKCENIEKIISNIEDFDPALKNILNERRISFYRSSSDLYLKVLFLYNFLNDIENAKYSLDLRSHLSVICGHDIAKTLISTEDLPNEIITNIWPKYGIQYALGIMNPLHKREDIENLYTNTKTWISLLIETKTCLASSSPYMLETNSVFRDATQVKDISDTLFTVKDIKGTNYAIHSLPVDLSQNINDISSIFENDFIYTNFHDRTDLYKVFLINNWASRIWRFSKNLSNSRSIEKFNSIYEIDASPGLSASTLLNAIFGYTSGMTYTEDPIPVIRARNNKNSLISLTYEAQDRDLPILSFEPKKYESITNNVKYGGIEYLDALLDVSDNNFNILKLKDYLKRIEQVEQGFTDSIKTLDLLNLQSILDSTYCESIFHFIEMNLKWDNSYYSIESTSVIAPIFSLAAKDTRVKGLLFAYTMLQIKGRDERRVTLDLLLNAINESPTIRKIYASSTTDNSALFYPEIYKIISREIISDAFTYDRDKFYLKIKGVLIELMKGLDSSLKKNQNGINVTAYGTYQDTTAYAVIFDMIVHMINLNSSISIDTIYSLNESSSSTIRAGSTETNFEYRIARNLDCLNASSNFRQKVDSNLRDVKSNTERENNKIRYGIISIVSTLRKLKNVFSAILNNATSNASLNSLKLVGNYFNDNNQLKLFLRSENQVHMMLNHLTELKTIETSKTNIFGRLGSNFKKEFFEMMKLPIFTNSSSKDLNILSIGIPYNIHNFLKKGNRPDRKVQDDIIKIKIYKLEHGYPFLIFKPKEYIFELSRFAARGNSTIKNTNSVSAGLIDSISRFATRDRSQVLSSNSQLVQYLDHSNPNPAQIAFQGNDYSYLTNGQKIEIFKNHVLSNILETYIQYMTFLDLNEMNFDVDPDAYQGLISDLYQSLAISHVKSFLTKRKISFPSIGDLSRLEEVMSSLPPGEKKQLDFELGILLKMNNVKSNISNFEAYARGICGTKYFDRVFHIMVDPHDFIIDSQETLSTGSDSIQRWNELKNSGLLIPSDIDQNQFVLRKNPAEIYSYFTNIEIL